jgi:phage terminase large subunit-like protein
MKFMSSPKPAKTAHHPKTTRVATKTTDPITAAGATSADATRLAAELERELSQGRTDAITPEALQAITAAICKTYSAQIESGNHYLPLAHRTAITSTDVMTMASGLLRAGNLAVFELGMWQSWTGR